MPKSDAARVLGMSPQGVEYRTYNGKLRTVRCPAGREWLIVDDVMRLMGTLSLEECQAIQTEPEPDNIPTVKDLLNGRKQTADNVCYDGRDSQKPLKLTQPKQPENPA
jgi:carbonic anhydrase